MRSLGAQSALLLIAATTLSCEAPAARPHIFLITSDTLRADHLSLHGYERTTSPNLAAFAEGAVRFTDALTTIPKTAPAFTTLLSGRHPQHHGVRANFTAIPPSLPMLPAQLQELGYRTAAWWSPDSKHIAYLQMDQTDVPTHRLPATTGSSKAPGTRTTVMLAFAVA